ncbi:MAG: PQQ-binding-like beta-propeller repeat protein [Candidatus Micrarchaeota archaeon]
MKKALILLVLVSLSFASLIWEYSTDGSISAKPVVFQNAIVISSDDGKVYGLDPATGAKKWQTSVGKTPGQPIYADSALYVPISAGKVVKLGSNGAAQWTADLSAAQFNASYIFGISVSPKYVFATANNGVYAIEKNGTVKGRIMSLNESVLTPPASGQDFVIFGTGRNLYRLSESGAVAWKATIAEGSFWQSRPVIDGSVVYVGSLDDRMHAYVSTNGMELWEIRADGWVAGTPLVKDGVLYFGAHDGKVYSAEASTGALRWTAPTQMAVVSAPESGLMGGQDVIFVGSTDRNTYAISTSDGEVLWKGTSAGAAGAPLFYQNRVVFGSSDGQVHAYSTERACSITSPLEADTIGRKELVVGGNYVSEAGGAQVLVQVNGGDWTPADTSDVDWISYLDPSAKLVEGINVISCQVADSGGSEAGPTYTTVTVMHDPQSPLSDFKISVSPSIIEGKPFTVYVNDADDGSPVDRFGISFDGVSSQADKNYTTTIDQPGTYKVTVKKVGFNDALVDINVNQSGISPMQIGIGAAVILIVVWMLWTKVFKQRFAKK